MSTRNRDIAFIGMFIAVVIGVGYALVFIPNVELVTAMIFISGVLLGTKKGIVIGVLGEILFSSLNPLGSGLAFPPMLAAQAISMGIIGAFGGILRRYVINWEPKLINIIKIGSAGFVLTLIYDTLVSLAYPVSAGFNIQETLGVISVGIAFSFIHLVANTIIFIIVVPLTVKNLIKAIPYFSMNFRIK